MSGIMFHSNQFIITEMATKQPKS